MSDPEIDSILKNLDLQSREILDDLVEMEHILIEMEDNINSENFDKEKLKQDIQVLRARIGEIENIDSEEYQEEREADSVIKKVKNLIESMM